MQEEITMPSPTGKGAWHIQAKQEHGRAWVWRIKGPRGPWSKWYRIASEDGQYVCLQDCWLAAEQKITDKGWRD